MAHNADTLATLAPTPEPPIKRLDASLPVPPYDPARYMGEALNGMADVKGLETLLSTKDAATVLGLSRRTLALLWHFLKVDGSLAMRACRWWRSGERVEDGLAHCWQAGLWRRSGDSFPPLWPV
jgi:hypothetical protein